MAVTLRVKNVDALTERLALGKTRARITLGIQLNGPAAEYGLIWEWGKVSIQPGPKTLWSTNPDGEEVVLTKTAPFGYIRVNRTMYRRYIKEEVAKINFHGLPPSQWNPQLEKALNRAAKRCANLIAETAPEDSGELKNEIREAEIVDTSNVDALSIQKRLSL